MEKKEILDHLSHIYLGPIPKKQKKAKKTLKFFINLFFTGAGVIVVLGFFIVLSVASVKSNSLRSQTALIVCSDIVKINFHPGSAKKEIYSVDLNNLNLRKFKTLGFSLRKANYDDRISLKVELVNASGEKSEIYLNDMPSFKWQENKINLSQFKNIRDWSEVSSISFIVEDCSTKENKALVYIDNVRFLS